MQGGFHRSLESVRANDAPSTVQTFAMITNDQIMALLIRREGYTETMADERFKKADLSTSPLTDSIWLTIRQPQWRFHCVYRNDGKWQEFSIMPCVIILIATSTSDKMNMFPSSQQLIICPLFYVSRNSLSKQPN